MSPRQLIVALSLCLWLPCVLAAGYSIGPDGERTSRISLDAVTHSDFEHFPKRPKPILELGDDFLGPGNIGKGWELATGAVWQPSVVVFGTYRTAMQPIGRMRQQPPNGQTGSICSRTCSCRDPSAFC